ncbi:MAG: alpha-D-ribose 1-methylphosphonate 5-triphosphate diphosphatase [Opitutales bacterium]
MTVLPPQTDTLIRNARLVLPDAVTGPGSLRIRNGRIDRFRVGPAEPPRAGDCTLIDGNNQLVLPGIIDLHTDALEKEIMPRPRADFPLEVAAQELENKLMACGVTTVFHSLHQGYQSAEKNAGSRYTRTEIFNRIDAWARAHSLIHTRIHLRFEVTGLYALEEVYDRMRRGQIALLSIMDHTPGQGQYPVREVYQRFERDGKSRAEADRYIAEEQARPRLDEAGLEQLVETAHGLGIKVASHDDDTPDKVRAIHALGIDVSEFPITPEAAKAALDHGMHTIGGASNVLRGGSLTGNLDVSRAIAGGLITGLCSDYYPPSILHAQFKLVRSGVCSLEEASRLVSGGPAEAVGLGERTGRIEPGLAADLMLVANQNGLPKVTHTLADGRLVHQSAHQPRRPFDPVDQLLQRQAEPEDAHRAVLA